MIKVYHIENETPTQDTGIGLFTGSVLARTVAVVVAMISIILSFLWLPYHPWWSLLIIAFDFVVIWALIFHGRDIVSD